MNKLIPFTKEIVFDSNIYEITSISLENTLGKNNNIISGDFIVSGEYRITETSINTLPFKYNIPFTIDIDETYDISAASIDINDFYYEIINDKVLAINIEVIVDNVKEILYERNEDMNDLINDNNLDLSMIDDINITNVDTDINITNVDTDINIPDVSITSDDIKKSLFNDLETKDNYVNYRVYIVRENDNLDSICNKYNVDKDILSEYNDLNDLKIGDKVIIPYVKG
jgi:hypothetical protein